MAVVVQKETLGVGFFLISDQGSNSHGEKVTFLNELTSCITTCTRSAILNILQNDSCTPRKIMCLV